MKRFDKVVSEIRFVRATPKYVVIEVMQGDGTPYEITMGKKDTLKVHHTINVDVSDPESATARAWLIMLDLIGMKELP